MTRGVILLVIDLVLLLALALVPIVRSGEEDQGDGFSSVLLPVPRKVNARRTAVFFGLVIASAIFAVLARNRLADWYSSLVANLTNTVTGTPNLSRSFHESVVALIPLLASFDIIIFSFCLYAPLTRRIASAMNALLLMALAISVNSLLLVIWHASGANVGPRTLIGEIVNIFFGTLVMFRVVMSSCQLPRPTAVRRGRRGPSVDGFLALVAIAAALVVLLIVITLFRRYVPQHAALLGAFVAYPLLWVLIFVGLFVFASRGKWPPITADKLPIDVIIPAYNEIAGIHLTLRSIDAAAVRYGGPVRVILADDGSTDGTGDVARGEMAAFRQATGIVVPGRHLGKNAALNTALSYAETHTVVRIDADVVIDDGAFLPLAAWFSDPTVGSVGGMTYPRQDGHSWFHKMRLFECIMSYGFTRQAQSRVDAVVCIPGTFTAFVREPAIEFGGFVVGMNGEDADLTMQLGRLGYRIIIDPRIVVFEDVPPTLPEFREQRIRWNRAGTQVAARHSPFRVGLTGPRIWLTYARMLSMRLTAILRPCVLTYLVALSIVSPESRSIVLTILGAYVISTTPLLVTMSLLAVRHRFGHRIPWLLCWWGFSMLRRAFVVEALLTIPTRPLRFPLFTRSGRLAEDAAATRADRPIAWPPG
jgi:cellulose synthase/poly-beta-1,6-N-acetylglucosamine synthase-like glycosyltransferase